MLQFLKNMFDNNDKEIRRLSGVVDEINALEPEIQKLSNAELRAKTAWLKGELADEKTLDEILPEAFAVVREAARRTLGQRHFDVQLMGGMVLHEGKIAEMKTGEGKTLAATLPAYLNALSGKGVHVVTVNDYLAKRDSEWMGQIYRFLGLSVGVILHDMNYAERKAAYACDITYGTNNEFGFDYLRDNMVLSPEEMVQRELNYAIVDEVDSILVDEARTPLIISGQAEESTDLYYKFARLVPRLAAGEDYTVDEKMHTVAINESGVTKMEQWLGVSNLYDEGNIELTHHLQQALKAHSLMKRDRDYVVKDGQVIIVDEFTGRLMFGRRYSDGLHQAIEAKEGVKIEHESQTLATITFQNYFRMYDKLAGMTGTAKTEEMEFIKIYNLEVVVMPTNRPMIRKDFPDLVFKTARAKTKAVVDQIEELAKKGQPVLVGTISVEKSEELSEALKKRGVAHQVLNAKYHEKEAEIIAQAGRYGAVTIATNMAGRGTDIILGGNPEFLAKERTRHEGFAPEVIAQAVERTRMQPVRASVVTGQTVDAAMDAAMDAVAVDAAGAASGAAARDAAAEGAESAEALLARAERRYAELLAEIKKAADAEHEKVVGLGGLFILGTERHESRRIDNQLRGRSGRQGDPGASRFYVSLEDDLMRLFGSDRIKGLMDRLGWEEDQPIEHNQVARAIENAQKKVEAHNFDIRKHVLEYDDVMNQQREVIYGQRRKVLRGETVEDSVLDMTRNVLLQGLDSFASETAYAEDWDLDGLADFLNQTLNTTQFKPDDFRVARRDELKERLADLAEQAYRSRAEQLGEEQARAVERYLVLRMIDSKWMDHLKAMDELREGIGLRAYGQRDPLVEYRVEAFNMFNAMVGQIQEDTVKYLFRVQVAQEEGQHETQRRRVANLRTNREEAEPVKQRRVAKVGRNDPCPCGSGKKYKKCCGA